MQTLTRTSDATPRSQQRFEAESSDFRFNQAPNARLFSALCSAYAASGGVAWGEDLARLLSDWQSRRFHPGLAHLIANKDVFHFLWQGDIWVPMVQFHLDDMSPNHAVRQVRRELGDRFDGWEAASWFVGGSDSLGGQRPVDLMARDFAGVLQAARADRVARLV